jgi:TetR/AcrR family transcriptional repressor of nem operon
MNRASTAVSTREKLLDQGVALIMEHGYHGAGLQTILQSIGVPKGSFYHYFASKEDFSAEVIQHYVAPFIDRLDHELQRPGIDARQALRSYFRSLTEEAARRDFRGGCLLGNLMGEIGETSEKCRAALHAAVARYRDKIAEALHRGQHEGVFRTDLSAGSMADLLVNQWQGALLRMKIEQSVQPLQDCSNCLLDGYFAV